MIAKADRPPVESYTAAAWLLMCDPAAIRAVAEVEAGPHGAFLDDGSPVILYERHKFHELTRGRFSGELLPGVADDIASLSSPNWGGYGPLSIQHKKLQAAERLDRHAALKSCSWGLFQILGLNHVAAGYPELQRFVNAMFRSVDDHLRAFCMFIRNNSRLVDSLRDRDWASFARTYNGPLYAHHEYDARMAAAYSRVRQETDA